MSDIASSDLPAGYTGAVMHDQIDRLIDDLLKNHDHSSGKGATVLHSGMEDNPIDGTYMDHLDLNKHVQGAGTTPGGNDDPGGSSGVHGLGSTEYVTGSPKYQYVVQVGTGTTDRETEIKAGVFEKRGRGTWTVAFVEPPLVWMCPTISQSVRMTEYQALNTSFAAKFCAVEGSSFAATGVAITFNWMAFGRIAL